MNLNLIVIENLQRIFKSWGRIGNANEIIKIMAENTEYTSNPNKAV